MKRLLFFVGAYDTLDLFSAELQKGFALLQYEILVFQIQDMAGSLAKLAEFIKKPVQAMITFNNLGLHMELEQGKNIWDQLRIPCVNILVDHPFCYHQAMQTLPLQTAVLCIDRNHMKYLGRFYPQIPVTGCLYHAGIEAVSKRRPIADRRIDVLYAGGFSRSFAEHIIPDFSQYTEFDAKAVCQDAYDAMIGHPSKTTEQALEESLLAAGVSVTDDRLKAILADLHFIELYAVSYYRETVIRTLVEAGIRVTIYGAGWDRCDWITNPYVEYGGKIPAYRVLEKMGDAKIVLNTMTWFKDGTHERVFNGMLQGAAVVSDRSMALQELSDGSDMLLFGLDEIERLPKLVKGLLSNPAAAQNMADHGYERAKKHHTWAIRAQELADAFWKTD